MDVGYRARRGKRADPAAGRADQSADIGIVDLSSGHGSDRLFRDELQLDDKCARQQGSVLCPWHAIADLDGAAHGGMVHPT